MNNLVKRSKSQRYFVKIIKRSVNKEGTTSFLKTYLYNSNSYTCNATCFEMLNCDNIFFFSLIIDRICIFGYSLAEWLKEGLQMLMEIYIYCKENIVGFFMTEKQTAIFGL